MNAHLPLRVPSRFRNAPRLADLAQVPGNVFALPGAAAEPVAQGNRPGRHPDSVVGLHRARLARSEQQAARRALLDEMELDEGLLRSLFALAEQVQGRIALARQSLRRMDACTANGKGVQQ